MSADGVPSGLRFEGSVYELEIAGSSIYLDHICLAYEDQGVNTGNNTNTHNADADDAAMDSGCSGHL